MKLVVEILWTCEIASVYFVLVVFNVRCEKRMEVIDELRRVLFYAEEGEQLRRDCLSLVFSYARDIWPRKIPQASDIIGVLA